MESVISFLLVPKASLLENPSSPLPSLPVTVPAPPTDGGGPVLWGAADYTTCQWALRSVRRVALRPLALLYSRAPRFRLTPPLAGDDSDRDSRSPSSFEYTARARLVRLTSLLFSRAAFRVQTLVWLPFSLSLWFPLLVALTASMNASRRYC